jgi:Iron-binding zinc finger CDGSH type
MPLRRPSSSAPPGRSTIAAWTAGPQEQAPDETVVDPRPDGPLFVRGRLRIVGDEGGVIREDTRVALCRCGGSANKPFCDGTHRRIGFTTG